MLKPTAEAKMLKFTPDGDELVVRFGRLQE
jgi:hypothetical protein